MIPTSALPTPAPDQTRSRDDAGASSEDQADRLVRFRRVLEGLLGVPATEGNRVDILRNGEEIFPAMLDAINAARHTVDLTSYVYWTGDIAVRFADALSERARAGLRVRILLDAVGAHSMNSDLSDQMIEAGCELEWFRQVKDVKVWDSHNRTHRKVLVCDEEVAFIGGVGIAEEWEGGGREPGQWRDTHFGVRGPAVDGLRAAFIGNWAETGRPLFTDLDRFPEQPQDGDSIVQVVQCASQVGWTDMSTAMIALIGLARDNIRLTSAYFVPDEQMTESLCEASRRGVVVDVLMPGEHTDKRIVQVAGEAEYDTLFEAGVRIWRYQPTMLHAKILTIDGIASCVGSANFDVRSMRLNEEANLVVLDQVLTAELDRQFAEDLEFSEQVDSEQWSRRGPVQRMKEAVTGLFDDQL